MITYKDKAQRTSAYFIEYTVYSKRSKMDIYWIVSKFRITSKTTLDQTSMSQKRFIDSWEILNYIRQGWGTAIMATPTKLKNRHDLWLPVPGISKNKPYDLGATVIIISFED